MSAMRVPPGPGWHRRKTRRARSRLGRMVSGLLARRAADQPAVEPLVAVHRRLFPRADLAAVRHAYAVAELHHRGQTRKSGAPYITHPLAVALILAELGMDSTSLIAALLHDTVEDTELTLGEIQAEFGDRVALLVDGVTKLDGSRWGDRAEAETFRKMILVAADDLRVLVIKLADRLHNLRTLRFQPTTEQQRIARVSLELLVPFAERLGIYMFKREMEDLAFAALRPEAYEWTRTAMSVSAPERAAAFAPIVDRLRGALRAAKLKAKVFIRDRHVYWLHTGRHAATVAAGSLPSALATASLVVLIDGVDIDCYVALGVLHSLWLPVPGRMRDFIALPKYNMYQSLHTSVVTVDGSVVDVQIRTERMQRLSELGIIAQIGDAARAWPGAADNAWRRPDLQWLRGLLAWQAGADSAEFLDALRIGLRSDQIVAFTVTGEVVSLPAAATALDFAYAVSAELRDAAVGAVVNGRLAPLSGPLRDGAVVEILTSPDPDATAPPGPLR